MTSRLPPKLLQHFEQQFDRAFADGMAPFPLPLERANRTNSSPFITSETDFIHRFSRNESRRQKIDLMLQLKTLLCEHGLHPTFGLCGGSFVDPSVDYPRDFDIVVFYEGALDAAKAPGLLGSAEQLRNQGLDYQLHPADVAPVLIARIAAFYAGLYLQKRIGDKVRAAVLIVYGQ